MMNTCALGMRCWVTAGFIFVAWWLLASVLLWLTWNRVLGELTRVKKARIWQPMLLLATIIVLVAPCCYFSKKECSLKPHDCSHSSEKDAESGSKPDCPYSRKSHSGGAAPSGVDNAGAASPSN